MKKNDNLLEELEKEIHGDKLHKKPSLLNYQNFKVLFHNINVIFHNKYLFTKKRIISQVSNPSFNLILQRIKFEFKDLFYEFMFCQKFINFKLLNFNNILLKNFYKLQSILYKFI